MEATNHSSPPNGHKPPPAWANQVYPANVTPVLPPQPPDGNSNRGCPILTPQNGSFVTPSFGQDSPLRQPNVSYTVHTSQMVRVESPSRSDVAPSGGIVSQPTVPQGFAGYPTNHNVIELLASLQNGQSMYNMSNMPTLGNHNHHQGVERSYHGQHSQQQHATPTNHQSPEDLLKNPSVCIACNKNGDVDFNTFRRMVPFPPGATIKESNINVKTKPRHMLVDYYTMIDKYNNKSITTKDRTRHFPKDAQEDAIADDVRRADIEYKSMGHLFKINIQHIVTNAAFSMGIKTNTAQGTKNDNLSFYVGQYLETNGCSPNNIGLWGPRMWYLLYGVWEHHHDYEERLEKYVLHETNIRIRPEPPLEKIKKNDKTVRKLFLREKQNVITAIRNKIREVTGCKFVKSPSMEKGRRRKAYFYNDSCVVAGNEEKRSPGKKTPYGKAPRGQRKKTKTVTHLANPKNKTISTSKTPPTNTPQRSDETQGQPLQLNLIQQESSQGTTATSSNTTISSCPGTFDNTKKVILTQEQTCKDDDDEEDTADEPEACEESCQYDNFDCDKSLLEDSNLDKDNANDIDEGICPPEDDSDMQDPECDQPHTQEDVSMVDLLDTPPSSGRDNEADAPCSFNTQEVMRQWDMQPQERKELLEEIINKDEQLESAFLRIQEQDRKIADQDRALAAYEIKLAKKSKELELAQRKLGIAMGGIKEAKKVTAEEEMETWEKLVNDVLVRSRQGIPANTLCLTNLVVIFETPPFHSTLIPLNWLR